MDRGYSLLTITLDASTHSESLLSLNLSNLTVTRGGFTLGPLSCTLSKGSNFIIGPNGAGKSTLFESIARLESAARGAVNVTGQKAFTVGYLPQNPILPARATCRQFLTYVCWLHRMHTGDRELAVEQALSNVGLLGRGDAKIHTLSGGMKRRLGIAQAIVHRPDVVLLDEPSAGLDPVQRISFRKLIATLAPEQVMLISTHLVDDVEAVADRILVLNEGKILFDGTVLDLEAMSVPEMPGQSDLERALMALFAPGGEGP